MDKITVREYIEYLKKLDQNKRIWVLYDGRNSEDYAYSNGLFPPIPDDDTAFKPLTEIDDDVEVGDYIISAG